MVATTSVHRVACMRSAESTSSMPLGQAGPQNR